jgi:type II secretory pathway predicted ATPase ExeA
MSIEQIRSHFVTKMFFGKDLAPSMLHRRRGHQEALARISFLLQEQAIGVLTGEVGSGKTVAARAAISELEPSRHSVIYLANPAIGATCPGERTVGQRGHRVRTKGRSGL